MSVEDPPRLPGLEALDPADRALDRARHYRSVQRFELAEKEVAQALALRPADANVHCELGLTRIAAGRWAEASEPLIQAVSLAPEWAQPVGLLAAVRLREGRYPESEKLHLEALRLDPEWPFAFESYGDLMRVTGHLDKARKLYERCLALDPERAQAASMLALVHSEQERKIPALHRASEGLALAPEDSFSHVSRGAALLDHGHPFQARRALREALRLDPTDPEVEELWLRADKSCRIVYLPFYHWTRVVRRLPGRQFFVWGVFIALVMLARTSPLLEASMGAIAIVYILFCLYTWVAEPLAGLWIRIVPPR